MFLQKPKKRLRKLLINKARDRQEVHCNQKQFKDKRQPSDPNLNRKRIEKQHDTSIQIFQSKETASQQYRDLSTLIGKKVNIPGAKCKIEVANETFLFRRTKMSEWGKSNSISRSRTHTNRSTAEKQTSKNKKQKRVWSKHFWHGEQRKKWREMLQTVPDVRVRGKGKTERWRERRSGRIHKQNHKSHRTQTLYERKETQHGTIKREREEHVNLPTSLPTPYLSTYVPT